LRSVVFVGLFVGWFIFHRSAQRSQCWVKFIYVAFKYKIQKYIYVFTVGLFYKILYKIQNVAMAKNCFSNDINGMVQTLSLLMFNEFKQIVLVQKNSFSNDPSDSLFQRGIINGTEQPLN